jgi:HEAT repeat protein
MRARFDDIVGAAARAPRWWMAHGLQAAAAVILVAFGFLVGRQTRPVPLSDPTMTELREELRATRQMVSLSLLQQQSASERLRGITYTTQIERPGGELVGALLDTLLHDPDVNVRLRSIDALKRFADRDNVRRAATDALTEPASSPLVQIALIDFLVEANDRGSVTSLRRLADDTMTNKAVRARAAWGLQHIG